MVKKVVGVCSANVQRSAIYEAVVKDEVRRRGLTGILEISSAGLNVKKILTNRSSPHIQLRILEAGLEYGLVRNEINAEVERVVANGLKKDNEDQIRAFYGEIRPLVHGYILAMRNEALRERGIHIFPTPYTPFDSSAQHDLVLPMTEALHGKIAALYDEERPRIQTYGSLVGEQELVDDLKSGLDGARRSVQYFMETREKAIEAMLELASTS